DERPAVGRGHCQPPDVWPLAAIAVVGDAVLVAGERVGDLVRLDVSLAVRLNDVRIGVDVLVPLVARLEYLVCEVGGGVVAEVESVDVDGLVGPLPLQTQLAPGADVLLRAARPVGAEVGPRPAAVAGRAEHA